MDYIKIPERDLEQIKFYNELDSKVKKRFLEELQNFEKGTMPNTFIKILAEGVGLSRDNASGFLSLVMNFHHNLENSDLEAEEYYRKLYESLLQEDNLGLEVDVIIDIFKELVENTNKNLLITLQALTLYGNNQKVYYGSKVFHEIRPIFVKGQNEGSLCIHKFKMEFRQNDDVKEIFMALDTEDLKKLKHSIETAEKELKLIKENSDYNLIEFK